MTVLENNNIKELERACLEGDLEKVISLTTNSSLDGAVKINSNNNYFLRAACLKGHVEIVNFLLSQPSSQNLKGINSPSQISDAIHTSIKNGQSNVVLFFKTNYEKEFTKYLSLVSKLQINMLFDSLTMNGNLECIELLQNSISPFLSLNLDVLLFFKKSMQYSQASAFQYWLDYVKPDIFINEQYLPQVKSLVNTALYCKKGRELKLIVDKFNLDLSSLIPFQGLGTIIETSPESLSYIISECGYSPSEEVVEKVIARFSQMPESSVGYKEWGDFAQLIIAQKEKEKLSSELVSLSSASLVVNKI